MQELVLLLDRKLESEWGSSLARKWEDLERGQQQELELELLLVTKSVDLWMQLERE